MLKSWNTFSTREKLTHLVLYLIGVGIMPAGAVLTINAHLGAGGYDALNFVLADLLHIRTSLAIYSTAFIILITAALIRKSYPRVETFISSFFLGISTDFWKTVLSGFEGKDFMTGLLLLVTGIIIIAFAVASYMISIFPTNPSDDLILALKERGCKIGIAKMSFDIICVVLAFLLGGEIGIGTIIVTLCLGPVIDFFHKYLTKLIK